MERQLTDRDERDLQRRHEDRAAGLRPWPATRPSEPLLTGLPFRQDPGRRVPQLLGGLALYGLSLSLMVRASLGVSPWSVLYQGLERHTPLSFGTISAVLGLLVLLLWIPLRQRPAFGTVANVVVLACASDLGLALVPTGLDRPARLGLLVGGVLLNGLSVAVYVGARFGPGPRDGLVIGLSEVCGGSLRLLRTLIEVTVLVAGGLLGGSVGVGTVLYALAVGPITQALLPRFTYRTPGAPAVHPVPAAPPLPVPGGRSARSRWARSVQGRSAQSRSARIRDLPRT